MTDEKIATVLEYEAKATPGPWSSDWDDNGFFDLRPLRIYLQGCPGDAIENDIQFIIRARTDLPEAMREIQRLKRSAEALSWFSQQKGSLEYESDEDGEDSLLRPWCARIWLGATCYGVSSVEAIEGLRAILDAVKEPANGSS